VFKYISLKASIGLMVVIACVAVLTVSAQAWFTAANPLAVLITSATALIVLIVLGVLIARGIEAALGEIGALVDGMGSGKLAGTGETQLSGEFGALVRRLHLAVENLGGAMQRIEQAAWTVSQAGDDVQRECLDLSASADEQTSVLSQAESSMSHLATTVMGNAEHAQRATRIAGEAESCASEGAEVLTTAIVAMDEIAGSGRRIGEVVAIIDSIAFQTNLLALNAAVEAARAGESGRGFAVVASEVRNLAQRASASAKEIRELIRVSVEAVEQGEHLVSRTGETFSEIRGAVLKVNEIVSEIVAASAQQRSDIDEVNRALDRMGHASRSTTELADHAAAAAGALAQEARGLTTSLGGLRTSAVRAYPTPRRNPPVRALESPEPGGDGG